MKVNVGERCTLGGKADDRGVERLEKKWFEGYYACKINRR